MFDKRIYQGVPENAKYGKYDVYYEGTCLERNRTFAGACSSIIGISDIKVQKYHLVGWRWQHHPEYFLDDENEPEYCAAISYLHPVFWDGELGEMFIFEDLDFFGVLRFGEHIS